MKAFVYFLILGLVMGLTFFNFSLVAAKLPIGWGIMEIILSTIVLAAVLIFAANKLLNKE